MQTVTHAVVGLALAAVTIKLFPGQPLAAAAVVVGSIAPDGPTALAFFLDKLRGRPPLKIEPAWLLLLKNVTHNNWLWLTFCAASMLLPTEGPWGLAIFGLGLGGAIHVVIDVFSHNGPQYRDTESRYFWPAKPEPQGIGSWDYRYGTGVLWPLKTPELVTVAVASSIGVITCIVLIFF